MSTKNTEKFINNITNVYATLDYVDDAVANSGEDVDLSDYATKEQVDTLARVLCNGGNILNLDLTMEEIEEISSLEDNSYITLQSISASIISEVVNGENSYSRVSLSNLIGFEISSTGSLWEDFIDCADAIRCRLVRNDFDSPNTIYPDLPEKSHCTTYVENYFVGVKYGTEEVVFGKTYRYEYNHVTKKYVDDATGVDEAALDAALLSILGL